MVPPYSLKAYILFVAVILSSPLLLKPAAVLFCLQPAFFCALRWLGLAPGLIHMQSITQQGRKTTDGIVSVGALAAPTIRIKKQYSLLIDPPCQPLPDQLLLVRGQAPRSCNIKPECYPGTDLVHMLAAFTTAAGKGKGELG